MTQSINTDYLVELVARKLHLSKTLVKSIINDCYEGIRIELKDPTSPAVLIHKLGTIEIQPNTLKAHMHQRFTIYDDPIKLEKYTELLNKAYNYKTNGKQRKVYTTEDFKRS